MEYPDVREQIITLVEESQSLEGLTALRQALAYPAELSDVHMAEAMLILAQIAEDVDDADLAVIARLAANNVDDADALYAFGRAAYQRELHTMATFTLARANRLTPNTPAILSELCSNFEALMQHRAACEVLQASAATHSHPLCAYLLAFHTVMLGDLDSAKSLTRALQPSSDPDLQKMVVALEGMLARADALQHHSPLDDGDLRGWHALINGALLLHLSPYGYEEPMRGRYAYVSDSYTLIRDGIESLRGVLATAEIKPARLWALPDRGSRIVAHAAGQMLGIPVQLWPSEGSEQPGLIVAYDLDVELSDELLQTLYPHRPGQLLWAHASRWTSVFPFAPDITTFLYQTCSSPWGEGAMQVDPDTNEVSNTPADDSPVEEIAGRILSAEPEPSFFDHSERLARLVKALAGLPPEHAAGMFRSAGVRCRQRPGSPVGSARFE